MESCTHLRASSSAIPRELDSRPRPNVRRLGTTRNTDGLLNKPGTIALRDVASWDWNLSASHATSCTPHQFITKWTARGFGERQAAQTWFLDLLRLVGHPDPIEYNDRDNFTFEKPVPGGFADAYLAGHFGWEFKGREADLPDAFNQLLRYQVYLRTPPLLIVSSFQMIRIQTNFPGKETVVHEIPVSELDQPEQLQKLETYSSIPPRSSRSARLSK